MGRRESRIHAAVVLGTLVSELRRCGKISQKQADALVAISMPDSMWGMRPPSLGEAIRKVLRPRAGAHGKSNE